jgi:hypothetical protein
MNKAKARIICYGIDDELKNSTDSIYSTVINSTLYPVPTAIAPNLAPAIEGTRTGVEAVNFTQRLNTKRFRFSLNPNIKNLKLSQNARLVIESITIPNVINDLYLQSKCVNNVVLRLKGISNHNLWDSSSQGKGNSIIFTCPILLNTQGFGRTLDTTATANPDLITSSQKARINCDNNGYLFTNTNPNMFYNFSISEDFLKNGILEFELIYDIGNITKLTTITSGGVNTLTLTNGGTGYVAPVTVNFNGGGGTGASATVTDLTYPVGNVFFTNQGLNYTSDPTLTISAPPAGGTTATATPIRGYPINTSAGVNISNTGTGYGAPPNVVFSPPPPIVNATATATVAGGLITGLTITDAGLGYVANPIVTVTGGGGINAVITANYSTTTTRITGFTITNAGTGYTTAPTITITGGGGITAQATVNVTSGSLSGFNITNAGSGYTTAPTITIIPTAGGTGMAISVILNTTVWVIRGATITSAGSGYLTAPTLTVTGGTSSTPAVGGTILSNAGTIRTLTLVTGGTSYTTAPTLTFTGSGATGTGGAGTTTIIPTEAHYIQTPQTLDINTDKNDLESFMISMVITDEEEDDKIYNDKKLLNKINRLILDKSDK